MKKITREMMALAGFWLLRFVLYVCAWLSLGAMVILAMGEAYK